MKRCRHTNTADKTRILHVLAINDRKHVSLGVSANVVTAQIFVRTEMHEVYKHPVSLVASLALIHATLPPISAQAQFGGGLFDGVQNQSGEAGPSRTGFGGILAPLRSGQVTDTPTSPDARQQERLEPLSPTVSSETSPAVSTDSGSAQEVVASVRSTALEEQRKEPEQTITSPEEFLEFVRSNIAIGTYPEF